MPRGAEFCPACGTAVHAPPLPFESLAVGSAVSERDVALGANRPNPRRGALVVAVVAVALVGVSVIVGVGGGDDGDEQVSPTPTATVAAPTTTRARPTRTTVNRTPTSSSSAVPAFTAEPIAELGGVSLYAVVNERVVRIDTATGESVVLCGGAGRAQEWSLLVAREGGVVVNDDSARFCPDDGSPPVRLGGGHVWPAADPALVWQHDQTVDEARLVQVSTGDEVAVVAIPAFSYPEGDDGTGRLLLRPQTGGTFTIDPATGAVARFSDVPVVAVTATHWLQLRCDEQLACGYEVAHRATGETTPVPLGGTSDNRSFVLAPSGSHVAIIHYGDSGPSLTVVDLATGAAAEPDAYGILQSGRGETVRWTADGQRLVWVANTSIAVWTTGADEPVRYRVTKVDGDRAYASAVALGA